MSIQIVPGLVIFTMYIGSLLQSSGAFCNSSTSHICPLYSPLIVGQSSVVSSSWAVHDHAGVKWGGGERGAKLGSPPCSCATVSKTPGLEIFKMWSILCIFKIDEEIANFVQILIYLKNENCLNISYLCQFLRYKTWSITWTTVLYFLYHKLNIRNSSV